MKVVKEDYVNFETAKLLKEKGFDVYGDGSFGSETKVWMEYSPTGKINDVSTSRPHPKAYPAPTFQMAMKWLREKCYCHIVIDYTFKADANLSEEYVSYCFRVENAKTYIQHAHNKWYSTYEEACEAAIKYCLTNLIE